MLDSDLKNLSVARLAHANDCLHEAEILFAANEFKGTTNRSYYAAFHAMRAVLIPDGFDSKKHSCIIAKFRELYLKTDLFDRSVSDAVSSLFRVRTASDYDDFYIVSKQDATQQLEYAKKLLTLITNYLKTKEILECMLQ